MAPASPQNNKPQPLLLLPFLKYKATLYTSTNAALPCTIEPASSRSFITLSTLQTCFAPLHLQLENFHTPLPSIISPLKFNNVIAGGQAKVKVLKAVRLSFALKDLTGERVELVTEGLVSEDKGLEGVRLGCDFLRGCAGWVESGEGGGVLVIGGEVGRKVARLQHSTKSSMKSRVVYQMRTRWEVASIKRLNSSLPLISFETPFEDRSPTFCTRKVVKRGYGHLRCTLSMKNQLAIRRSLWIPVSPPSA
ncbi:hypothetical protein N431DRAFT_551838 [Stipitochalara longipes BDJ]|nr:hypothetical protein N431DRAFT_551838 [Stipitochalara longipes BDJ]